MSSDIEIEGLDEFEKSLTKFIEQTYPKEFEDMVIKVAVDLQNAIMDKTPVDTSHLQSNWFVGDLVKKGNSYVIEVYNNVEYASPVTDGHRTKSGSYVKGAHMVEISVEMLQLKLTPYLKDWLSSLLNQIEV